MSPQGHSLCLGLCLYHNSSQAPCHQGEIESSWLNVHSALEETMTTLFLCFYSRNLGKSGLRVSCLGLGKYSWYHVGWAGRWKVGEDTIKWLVYKSGPHLRWEGLCDQPCPTPPSDPFLPNTAPCLSGPRSPGAHDALGGHPTERNLILMRTLEEDSSVTSN